MTKALIAKAKATLENFLKENEEFVVNMNNGICFKHYGNITE